MIPDGDRRHLAQSGSSINEHEFTFPGHDHIVAVLVLHDDIRDDLLENVTGRLAGAPVKDLSE